MATNYDSFLAQQGARLRHKLDASKGFLFENLTRQIITQLASDVYDETRWASEQLISTRTDAQAGKAAIEWYRKRHVKAPGNGFAGDHGPFPMASLEVDPTIVPLHSVYNGYTFTMQQAEAWQAQGFSQDLPSALAEASSHDWHLNVDAAWRDGVSGVFEGVLDIPGSLQLTAGSSGTTAAWATTATPDQICDSFTAVRMAIDNAGPGLKPDTVVFPSTIAGKLLAPRYAIGGPSIKQWLEESFPEITLWVYDRGMNTGGLDGDAAMLMYDRRPTTLWAWMPKRMEPFAEKIEHASLEQVFWTRLSGPICEYPKSIARLSGI
jgi:hypothetical protein